MKATRKDGRKVQRGPYFLYSRKEKGRTISRRLKDPEEVARCREQIEAFRHFRELTAKLVEIGEQISDLALGGERGKRLRSAGRD